MVWEPFVLAIVMGLAVSAALYFIVLWPQVEPDDGSIDAIAPETAPGPDDEAVSSAS